MKKLENGSVTDVLLIDQPQGTWGLAKNITNYKKFGTISNEDGCDNITPNNFPTKPVIGFLAINKKTVYFFSPSIVGNDSEIGIVDNIAYTYTTILKDIINYTILNFDINYPIQATYEYKFNNNLIIAWRDSLNDNKILNIDCPSFTIDFNKTATTDYNRAKALIKLFPDVLTPNITDINVNDNGGNLKTGVIYPIVSYELKDKSITSWLKVYNPIPIVQSSKTEAFIQYDGDASDLPTSKKLSLTFADIDTNYLNLRFGVIIMKNGVLSAYYVSSFKISGTGLTIDFTGSESTITLITLDEVLIPNAIYPKAGTITNLLGRLYLGKVEKRKQVQFQKFANMISVKWVQGNDISLTQDVKSSYKDSKVTFFDKSFKSNEIYALYLAFKYKDGTYSDGFHIPGRRIIAGEDDIISNTNIDYLDSNVPNFRLSETALIDGTEGFWENDSESYPDIDDFDSTNDYNGNTISGGYNLQGQKVRHHKLPEINLFEENSLNYFNKITDLTGFGILGHSNTGLTGYTDYYLPIPASFNSTALTITSTGTNTKIVSGINNTLVKLTGTFSWNFDLNDPDNYLYISLIFDEFPAESIILYRTDKPSIDSISIEKYFFLPIAGNEINCRVYVKYGSSGSPGTDFVTTDFQIFNKTAVVGCKPLGFELSNINIPAKILDQVDSFEIFYAKRDSSNVKVIGQDIIIDNRFHTFDLVHSQANLRGSYLKPQINYPNYAVPFNFLQYGIENRGNVLTSQNGLAIKAIEVFDYLGEDVLIPYDNTNRSTSLYIKILGETVVQMQTNYPGRFWDICIYRKDVYKSFDTQELISTGTSFKIRNSGIQDTVNIFGGDVFISGYGFIERIDTKEEYLIPQESAANIGLRMDDETIVPSKYYYPKHNHTVAPNPTISYYGYNDDYTALNNLNKVFPHKINYDNCNNDIFQFDYLIARSVNDANESLTLGWRVFKSNDYYDALPKDKGVLTNLLGENKVLYIQLENALLIAEVKDMLQGTNTYLATTDVFDRPPIEVIPDKEGYIGGQSQFAIILCPMGYITIDRQKGKIFAYKHGSQNPLTEISGQGYYKFFLNNTQTSNANMDNPFIGNGLICAYDKDFGRLIIVKKTKEVETNREFTMSYCPDVNNGKGGWLCEHDYHPHAIFSSREGLFGVDNITHKLYQHNSNTLKGIYYNDIMYNSYIDVVFNNQSELTKYLSNVNWLSSVQTLKGITIPNETLTHIMIYNENQCSGIIDLRAENNLWFGKDVKNVEKTWNYNKFKDLIKVKTDAFLDSKGDLISSNINNSKNWFDKNKFISKFVVVRFIYDNVNQRDLYIDRVGVNIRESNR